MFSLLVLVPRVWKVGKVKWLLSCFNFVFRLFIIKECGSVLLFIFNWNFQFCWEYLRRLMSCPGRCKLKIVSYPFLLYDLLFSFFNLFSLCDHCQILVFLHYVFMLWSDLDVIPTFYRQLGIMSFLLFLHFYMQSTTT